jgi:long-chain acyl-CoA synthetase
VDFHAFEERGKEISAERLREYRSAVVPDTPSTFIYTSGTTGPPQAVILTHRNNVAAARNVQMTMRFRARDRISCTYLSLAHVAERTINLLSPLLEGRTVYFWGQRTSKHLKEIGILWAGSQGVGKDL